MNPETIIETTYLNALAKKMFEVQEQARDNLFSANHRNAMIQVYGHTEAEIIKLEDLI